MEAVKTGERPLVLSEMRRLLFTEERFSTDPDDAEPYLAGGADAGAILAVVKPRTLEEIKGLIVMANASCIALYTPMPFGLEPKRPGVIVDPGRMNRIFSLDSKKLTAVIEPGVTWEQMLPEVEALGLRMAVPAAARQGYVLGAYQERDIVLSASRYTNKQVSNLHLVLADGREYRSGSHALPMAEPHGINWREDGGPNLSRLMLGSRNMFGLAHKGYVYLYPHFEKRQVTVLGFNRIGAALKAAQFIANREMAVECVTLNRAKAEAITGKEIPAPWLTVAAIEGSADLVKYYRKRLSKEFKDLDELKKLAPAFEGAFRSPWEAPDTTVGFYTFFSRVPEFDKLIKKPDVPRMVVPVKRGASVYNHYELPERPDMKVYEKLLDAGAFFSSPTGSLAHALFARTGDYEKYVRIIKRRIDPGGIMNPDQMIEEGGDV